MNTTATPRRLDTMVEARVVECIERVCNDLMYLSSIFNPFSNGNKFEEIAKLHPKLIEEFRDIMNNFETSLNQSFTNYVITRCNSKDMDAMIDELHKQYPPFTPHTNGNGSVCSLTLTPHAHPTHPSHTRAATCNNHRNHCTHKPKQSSLSPLDIAILTPHQSSEITTKYVNLT